jgi:hypothetical protein
MRLRYLGLAFLMLVLSSCRKEQASWESDWVFPLINDSLKIGDYVNDSTFGVNADNSIQVQFKRDMLNLDLSTLVDIPDTTIEQTFSIALPSLMVSPGSEYVNQTEEHVFNLGDIVLLDAELQSGRATITVENPIATAAIFTVTLPGVTKQGVLFEQIETVPGASGGQNGKRTFQLDLAGYRIDMRGQNGNAYNILQSQMIIKSDPNGPTVNLTNADVFRFKVEFKDMKPNYARGYFGSQVLSGAEIIDVEELKNIVSGGIQLDDVDFKLILSNGVKVMAQGVISSVSSMNVQQNTLALNHPDFGQILNVESATGAWANLQPSTRELAFSTSNSNIKDFLEHLGYQYAIDYQLTINPWGNSSASNDEVFPNSRIKLSLETNFPLAIGANQLTLRDTFEVSLANQSQSERIVSGGFLLRTKNSFPYAAEITLNLLNEDGVSIGSVAAAGPVQAGVLNATADGHIPSSNELFFELPAAIMAELVDLRKVVVTAVFDSPQQTNNRVFATDALHLKLLTKFKLKTSF